MEVACSHCGAQHALKDEEVHKHPKVKFRCAKCGESTVVETKRRVDATMVISPLPSFARANASSSNLRLPPEDPSMKLPAQAAVVLTVTAGPGKGETHTISKPRVVLGRRGADVALKDPEISRHHCLLEVRDTYINLKDMDSTNGTFFDEERVRAAMLQDGSEFRVGTTVIRVNFRPK
jgi:Inner membrane component of T3SS, cytoplasmic domain/zinc-ribbon domain